MFLELLITVAIILLLRWWKMQPYYWRDKGVPYDVPLPLFGNSLGSFTNSFHEFWDKQYNRFSKKGGLYGFHNFEQLALMVSDPQALKEILISKSDCFLSRGMHSNPSYDITARNVFFISGEDWKKVRTKLTPFFSVSRLKDTTRQMKCNIEAYSNQLETAAVLKKAVNINELSLKLATDVVVNTIFGIKPDSFDNPNSFFFSLQEEIFGFSFVLKILLGTLAPSLYDFFRVTAIPAKTTDKLKKFVLDVVQQRRRNVGVRPDFIQGMVELIDKESSLPCDPTTPRLIEDDVISQCMAMYMGGTETTGNSISYLFHELALQQDIQEKTRQEIIDVLSQSEEKTFSYELLTKLTFTNKVINECLRKYPIVPVITRACTRPTNIAGVHLKEGIYIVVPIMSIHWDPKYYPEPEKFKPERFADDSLHEKFVFFPFGIGPRTCIGWKMAVIEMASTLCHVLPKYKFLPCDKTKDQIKFSWKPTLNPDGGIWLNIEKVIK